MSALQAGRFGMPLRVAGPGNAEGEVSPQVPDQVGSVGEFAGVRFVPIPFAGIAGAAARFGGRGGGSGGSGGRPVAAQGDDVLNAGGVQPLQHPVDIAAALRHAGHMRHHRQGRSPGSGGW